MSLNTLDDILQQISNNPEKIDELLVELATASARKHSLYNDEIIEIEFEQSPIPDGCARDLNEITIKRDGQIWRIHKSDVDPFPSNPHAENLESGLKMHLGNGRLYHRATQTGKSVSKKHLEFIRREASAKGVRLPPMERS